jgi:cytochrome c oxidase assembly factor CtaG
MIARGGPHWLELLPPLCSGLLYAALYTKRHRTLASERRAPRPLRAALFATGVVLLVAVQVGPVDAWADQLLAVHMAQHIVIGDICSLLLVLGLTGPMVQPLLRLRAARPLRVLTHPLPALVLWALDLYAWHLPLLYQLAIRHDLVHALEHACLLWFGALLWLALIGPLPRPAWFSGWGQLGYVALARLLGSLLGNAMIWAQTIFYPVYRSTDAARGLSPLSDQNIAGGLMMAEQMILTALLLGLLFYRFAIKDEERQSLVDFARARGVDLSDERARRAAAAGAGERLRARLDEGGRTEPTGPHAGR